MFPDVPAVEPLTTVECVIWDRPSNGHAIHGSFADARLSLRRTGPVTALKSLSRPNCAILRSTSDQLRYHNALDPIGCDMTER